MLENPSLHPSALITALFLLFATLGCESQAERPIADAAAFVDTGLASDAQPDARDPLPDSQMPMTTPPMKVLFVGNSLTYWDGGLAALLKKLRRSADSSAGFDAEQVVQGGASLEVMWNDTDARERIAEGGYDVVVLQEDLPETTIESFHSYARRFDEAIRASGATPLFYMAWEYQRLSWISLDEIAEAHWTIAAELGAPVAPVGLARRRAFGERPELDLYADDREHPSIAGSYLSALTIYASLFGVSPEGLSYRPSRSGGVSVEDAAFLQRIAWAEVSSRE